MGTTYNIEWYDVARFIKIFGYDDFTADVVAEYLDECGEEVDLTCYVWNVLPYFVMCFETKDEAMKHVEDEKIEDYTLYECENYDGVYLEWS